MTQPIIGVTMQPADGRQQINNGYVQSILDAGGVPLCIPNNTPIAHVLDRIDGLLVIGGDDIHPRFFSEDSHAGLGHVDPARDDSDLAAVKQALAHNLPLLAICRGEQVLNVAFGGSLYQHIPAQLPHAIQHKQQSARDTQIHEVDVRPDSKLADIVGTSIMTNSFHHQSVKDVHAPLSISATTSDGVIEAIEHDDYPFCIGVQWHPEELKDEASKKLFRAFIEACQ